MSDLVTFDADAFATKPPELRIDGRVYVGRVLSIVEWAEFLERFLATSRREVRDEAEAGSIRKATMLQNHDFAVEYLRAAVVVPEGAPDPVALLEAQGGRLLKQAFGHFFGDQCYVQGVALRTPTAAARDAIAEAPTRVPQKNVDGPSSSDNATKAPSDVAPPA